MCAKDIQSQISNYGCLQKFLQLHASLQVQKKMTSTLTISSNLQGNWTLVLERILPIVAQDACKKQTPTKTQNQPNPTKPKAPKNQKYVLAWWATYVVGELHIYKKTLQHHKDIKNQKQVRAINWKGEKKKL